MSDPAIKTSQFGWQVQPYLDHRDDVSFGLWWEMGLGKTKALLDVISHQYLTGQIEAVLIIAPKSVYTNWLDIEVPKHLAVRYIGMSYHTSGSRRFESEVRRDVFLDRSVFPGVLRFVTMSYDSLSVTEAGRDFATRYVQTYQTFTALDESSEIANPGTERARACFKIGDLSSRRWVMTGTPLAKSPFAAWSQLRFMDPSYWAQFGMGRYVAFRHAFGVFARNRVGGRTFETRVGFRQLDRLQKLVAPRVSRLLKEDSGVNLPPKIYTLRTFDMADRQREIYDRVRTKMLAQLDEEGGRIEASLAVVRLTRLHQIACGFATAETLGYGLPGVDGAQNDETMQRLLRESERDGEFRMVLADYLEECGLIESATLIRQSLGLPLPRITVSILRDLVRPEDNPRLQLLDQLLDEASGKVVVWCRFKRDVDMITAMLGDECVKYDGSVGTDARRSALRRFSDDGDPVRVLVANMHALSQGVTLTIAKTLIYYSQIPSLEKRLQSEDRAHRVGQDRPVHIIDVAAANSVDMRLRDGLMAKFDMAAAVAGDRMREWLR